MCSAWSSRWRRVDSRPPAVEIMNPGLFPAGTTPEDYLDGNQKASGSRNPNLAQALFRGGYIEAFGSGVRRIKEACDTAGVKVEYRQYNDETTVVFHRPGSQVEYVAAGSRASTDTGALSDPTTIRENETRKRDARLCKIGDGKGFHHRLSHCIRISDGKGRDCRAGWTQPFEDKRLSAPARPRRDACRIGRLALARVPTCEQSRDGRISRGGACCPYRRQRRRI